MADVNIIQRGDLQQRLIKGLEIVGERSPVSTLAPEIMATVLLEDLTKQNVGKGPVGRGASATASQTAVVAEFSTFELSNPSDSGVVLVVEHIGISVATSHEISFIIAGGTTGVVTAASEFFLDPRNGGTPLGIMVFGTRPALSGLSPYYAERVASYEDSWPSRLPIKPVIQPGDLLIIQGQTANLSLRAAVTWTEYDA